MSRAGASPGAARALPRQDLFRERLGALERLVDQAVEEAGAGDVAASPLADALESVLGAYAEVARAVDARGWLGGLTAAWGEAADEFGHAPAFDDAASVLLRALYRIWWRVDASGLEHVPSSGRAMLVANHAGGLFPYDAAMLRMALRDDHPAHPAARPLLDESLFALPLVGGVAARCGSVPASAENATRLLEREQVVIAFPEGVRGLGKPYEERYRLASFGRGGHGLVRAALRTGAPIVPVAVVGSEEIHPVLGSWDWLARLARLPYFPLTPTFPWLGVLGLVPLPSKWRIEVGAPLDVGPPREAGAADERALVRRLTEELRRRVQRMVSAAVARRGPAFF